MQQVPLALQVAFILTTILTVYTFYRASQNSKKFLLLALIWMTIQMVLGLTEFYSDFSATPPRFIFLIVPSLLLAIGVATTRKGKQFMASFDLKQLTLIHTIRIALEIILYYLFVAGTIPEIMTFEGRNFDIISGLSAPFVCYFAFVKKNLDRKALIVWNIVALGLAIHIVGTAILSARTPFQQFGLDQPNIVVEFFPFTWLPSVVVPILLFSHYVTLYRLLNKEKITTTKTASLPISASRI